jgi:hypothetical protein
MLALVACAGIAAIDDVASGRLIVDLSTFLIFLL